MDEAKHETNLHGVVQGFVQGEQNTITFIYQGAKERSGQIDWNLRLIPAKDLRSESLKLGDAAAAKFHYIITPIQAVYNEAIQALHDASAEREHIKHGILVLGESNSGKTRLAFEALREVLPSWPVLRWRPDYTMDDAPSVEFLREKPLVIFIDDLQDYAPASMRVKDIEGRSLLIDPRATSLRSLLETLYQAAQHIVVVATCRNEDKLRVQASLDWLIFQLKNIVIPSFNEDAEDPKAVQVITEFQKHGTIYIEDWDGTLGSLVLGLSTKNSQYLNLPTSTSRILQAMKLLTLTNTRVHTERRIRAVCAEIFGEKQFLENEQIWQESVSQLTQMQFVKEEIDEDNQEMVMLIRKDIYFEKVITDYPQYHRPYQLERDFVKLRKVFVELEDIQALLNLGLVQLTKEKHDEALKTFDCALALAPDSALLWELKALPYGIEGGLKGPEEGLTTINHALSLDSERTTAWSFKGTMLLALKRHEEALAAFDRALVLDPNNDYAWLRKGNTLEDLERHEEALAAFDQALVLNPTNTETWFFKGGTLRALERHEEALAALNQDLALNPTNVEAWIFKGDMLRALERHEEALAAFDHVLALDPTRADAWAYKGIILKRLERYEEALAAFDQALTLASSSAETWYNRGTTLEALERYEEALAAFDHILALDPTHADAWTFKGLTLIKLEQLEKALAAFDRALALDPDHAGVWYHKGIVLGGLAQPAEAVVALDHALALDPNNMDAWAFKARMHGIFEQPEEALAAFNRSLELDPVNASNWFLKGMMLVVLEQPEEALVAFDRSLTLDPTHADAWYHKGRVLNELKRYNEALVALDQALVFDPRNAEALRQKNIGLKKLRHKTQHRRRAD